MRCDAYARPPSPLALVPVTARLSAVRGLRELRPPSAYGVARRGEGGACTRAHDDETASARPMAVLGRAESVGARAQPLGGAG